ncbi:SusC/RagA family TonB-linked outer membrane protein [Rhodonellum sp.]|uniref:SusC/RagA family TonB-linked outer membrane protein n=1 Tax=Rhodonellum sp. TaxID=2231180 RepID=UPI00271A28B3|nr:SusC/RagA family TonB-linked outer membrane protein [Rhodonellum sp.]MDO9553271.1 SusC/RagA family TonB-linked outer membrane protein [Rhodonellum sp.]
MKNTLLILAFLVITGKVWGQESALHPLQGTVLSLEDQKIVPGALVRILNSETLVFTDEEGKFNFRLPAGKYTLEISYIGLGTKKLTLVLPISINPEIFLDGTGLSLEEVEVFSTGYQEIPKERATGSFVQLDRELLNRRVSSNIIDRLEDVSSGLILNRARSDGDPISIRGRSTLFSNARPLVVIDNFPYDGPLESINPNDVESITLLRDAAAASIWGAQAGNGVIVITTKSGSTTGKTNISFNSNISVFQQPNLYYVPQMNMPDFIETERTLFERNFYRTQERSANKPGLSPGVETLIKMRDGLITQEEGEQILERFKTSDIRSDLGRYYYSNAVYKQSALNINGASDRHRYLVSVGYDDNALAVSGNSNNRFTLTLKDAWTSANKKLEMNAAVFMTKANSIEKTNVPQGYPYERLADENGNPQEITRNFSARYKESVAGSGLLDWRNMPLAEKGILDHRTENVDWRINTGLSYEILEGLKASVLYQYWSNTNMRRDLTPFSSYQVRDLINQFTQPNGDGSYYRPVPVGDLLSTFTGNSISHNLRGQLSYSKTWKIKHSINALGGYELKNREGLSSSALYYGYRDELGLSQPVDHVTTWPRFHNPGQRATINSGVSHSGITDRFVSYFFNTGYSYDNRFDFTASMRKDQSNLFGVETNKRGVPLWSAGFGWNISGENFASASNFPYLKLRTTYGYNGNVDKTLSSLITARYLNSLNFSIIPNLQVADIINPPNPELRWERIKIANIGLDFETANAMFSGSLELYNKEGIDLIGDYPVPASTGLTTFRGNFANTTTRGLDLILTGNFSKESFRWNPNLLYSWVDEKVSRYDIPFTAAFLLESAINGGAFPVEGKPLFSIYSYKSAGLNPDTGNPIGFLNGEKSEEYFAITSSAITEDLVYHGSARPVHFGAFRNDFHYKNFSVSVNISYRMGYYYRRNSIDYFRLLRGEIGHGDYDRRWQTPGDELVTDIPSLPATANANRQNFYRFSESLVEKGDHVRLQDIRLSYTLTKNKVPNFWFQGAEIYAYVNNLGILWKASDDILDPDYQTAEAPKSIAFGIRLDF